LSDQNSRRARQRESIALGRASDQEFESHLKNLVETVIRTALEDVVRILQADGKKCVVQDWKVGANLSPAKGITLETAHSSSSPGHDAHFSFAADKSTRAVSIEINAKTAGHYELATVSRILVEEFVMQLTREAFRK
jgi:hypothetical protein